MKNITVADTLEMSIPERIQLVEDIWDTIAANVEARELTEVEKKMLDERIELYRRNPEAVSSWEDVYGSILKNHET